MNFKRLIKRLIFPVFLPQYRHGNQFYLNKSKVSIKGSRIRKSFFEFDANNTMVLNNAYLYNCNFRICGNNCKIIIEDNVVLHDMDIFIEDNGCLIHIKRNVIINGAPLEKTGISCAEGCKVIIGEKSLISCGVVITTGDGHSVLDKNNKRINPS